MTYLLKAFRHKTSTATDRGARPPPAPTTAAVGVSSPTRATLLVVDDSPVNRDLIRETLEPFGYRVLTAQSVAEGLVRLGAEAPDLILSDLHMPGADGFNF